jgi:hypothetical protein
MKVNKTVLGFFLMIVILIGSTEAYLFSFYNEDLLMGSLMNQTTANAGCVNGDSIQGKSMNNNCLNGLKLNGITLSQVQHSRDTTKNGILASRKIRSVQVQRTRFRAKREDGLWATDQELVGALLVAVDSQGIEEIYRIDSIEKASYGKAGEIFLYTFSVKDPASGNWINFCKPDAEGMQKGFPLSGYWDEKGYHIQLLDHYSLTCTGGVMAKCVKFGYVPWGRTKNGKSLWGYHQACTRLMRADYCGNGKPHTRDGTKIELWDREGIEVDTSEPGLTFEAAWNEDGAV